MDDVPLPAEITPADWEQTPLAVRRVLLAQRAQLQALQAQVAELTARLNQHSGNSSRPPSADPPAAPKRPARPPRGRRPGGQPGHPGAHRALLPPEQVAEIQVHRPTQCPHCQAALPADLPPLGEVQRQQVTDLPPIQPQVVEHQFVRVCCPHCQGAVEPPLPADLPPGAFGPQVVSLVALLHGRYRLSAREVVALLADLFGIDLSLGSVPAACQSVSAALEESYEQVQTAVQDQPVVNVDETSWKQAGAKRWLWVAVSTLCTLFMVSCQRNRAGLVALLDAEFAGIIGSDRHTLYDGRPVAQRQLCWAHLVRNLRGLAERGGATAVWADRVLTQTEALFAHWHAWRTGEIDRAELARRLAPVEQAIGQLLRAGTELADGKAAGFSRALLGLEAALWTFVRVAGVEPTNNQAERALRPAVLWRKGCFGAASEEGNTFVARILTVRATCQQQKRHLWTFLTAALAAHWADQPSPLLIAPPT